MRETQFTVEGVLSPAECEQWVQLGESIGFADAPITTVSGFVMMPDVRNNTRVMFDDQARAEALWERLRHAVGEHSLRVYGGSEYRALGVNERLRIYRYTPGQYFNWHGDGAFVRTREERSFLTAMVYLNDGFEGGTTDFEANGDVHSIVPKVGRALLFDHPLRHRGAPVESGTKYVLRTDVMYQRSSARWGL